LNSVAPSRGPDTVSMPDFTTNTYLSGSLDEISSSPAKTRHSRGRSPPSVGSANDVVSPSSSGTSPRPSRQSHLSAALGRGGVSRLSAYLSGSSAQSSAEGADGLTDDSTDSTSPAGSALEPMTPPNTPPTSHIDFSDVSPGTSPHSSRESSGWKKMGQKLGWKKSRSTHGSGSSSSHYPVPKDTGDESSSSGL
jgi:hypothetical protein